MISAKMQKSLLITIFSHISVSHGLLVRPTAGGKTHLHALKTSEINHPAHSMFPVQHVNAMPNRLFWQG